MEMVDIAVLMQWLGALVLLMITNGLTWLTAWVVPRTRKTRETAEAAIAKTDALERRLNLYDKELTKANARIERQGERIGDLEGHVDDLYVSIEEEGPLVAQRIKGRLKTRRPRSVTANNAAT